MQFTLIVSDTSFDNTDSEYIEIKLHKYTNMNNPNDINGDNPVIKDELVPIVECQKDEDRHVATWKNENAKSYCPKYREGIDYLYGDYNNVKSTFYRLAVHFCDKDARACKEQSEIEEYMSRTIVNVNLNN